MNELCQLAKDFTGDLPSGGALYEVKHDGFRGLHIRDWQGKPGLFTRGGIPIEGAEHILYELARMETAAGEAMMFDGEFVVDGTLAATKAWCERGWRTGGTAGVFHVFDCMPHKEWLAGGTERPLYQRKAMLRELMDAAAESSWEWRPRSYGADEGTQPVQFVEDGWAFDAQDVLAEARRVWAVQGEGIVLKAAEEPYRRHRSAAWLKVTKANAHKWQRAAMCSVT